MNTQAFPLEFLQKFFPELARAKATSVTPRRLRWIDTD